MKTADLFPSKYLKAADLDGDVEVTIRNVGKEDFKDDDGVIKPKGCATLRKVNLASSATRRTGKLW